VSEKQLVLTDANWGKVKQSTPSKPPGQCGYQQDQPRTFRQSQPAHGGVMLSGIMFLAAVVIAVYVFASFSSAIRMRLFYGVYAHIEYGTAKWRKFGKWTPRRLILLLRLRRLAVLALLVILACLIVKGSS
jgi:hypothetical protein